MIEKLTAVELLSVKLGTISGAVEVGLMGLHRQKNKLIPVSNSEVFSVFTYII